VLPTATLDLDPFKAIADLAQKEYANENDRTKVLDGKAGPLIGATGAGMAFILGAVVRPPDTINPSNAPVTIAYYAFVVGALTLLFIAEVFFLQSVRLRSQFQRIDVSAWVDFSVMQRPSWKIYADLAATYEAALRINTRFNDEKARLQAWGFRFLLGGTIVLLGVPSTVMYSVAARMLAAVPCSGWL